MKGDSRSGAAQRMANNQLILKAFAKGPENIGALAPSSRRLATRMVELADIESDHVVVELGAGTGPMTRALAAAHGGARLFALEPDPELAKACRSAAPSVHVEEAFAQELPSLIRSWGISGVDRVVSSLPFAGWKSALQEEVFGAILEVMKPGGRMVTFSYAHSPWLPAGRRAKRRLNDTFASVTRSKIVWANLPPAFVYICDKEGAVNLPLSA